MPQFETSTYLAQIVWLLLCFCSLWFAMSWFIIPKIEDIIEQRRRKIDGYVQKAEKINKQALSSLEKYNSALKKAKEKADIALAENSKELSAELMRQRSDNQKALAQKVADNDNFLQKKRKEALDAADEISSALALDILHKTGFDDVTPEKLIPYTGKEQVK